MEVEIIESDCTTAVAVTIMNQKAEKQANLELVKTEAPEGHDIPLQLLQHKILTIKSEPVSTADKLKSATFSTLEPEGITRSSLELKSELLAPECHFESMKQELLHEELDIKYENEVIQRPCLDDTYNGENQSLKCTRILSGLEPFKCSICDNSFSQKDDFKRHLRTHTGDKPFKCNICHYRSTRNDKLTIHLRTHTGEKPFKCNICDYSATQKSSLNRHLRTHTGEKPYKCNICDYSATQNDHLKAHLRTHTGEKLFKCNICDYSFTRNENLKAHLRTHTFKCNICDDSSA